MWRTHLSVPPIICPPRCTTENRIATRPTCGAWGEKPAAGEEYTSYLILLYIFGPATPQSATITLYNRNRSPATISFDFYLLQARQRKQSLVGCAARRKRSCHVCLWFVKAQPFFLEREAAPLAWFEGCKADAGYVFCSSIKKSELGELTALCLWQRITDRMLSIASALTRN